MQQINNNQHFLLLTDINSYPEIKTNTIAMVEQIMNAHILLNKQNIQCGIERVLEIEYYCQLFLADDYTILLKKLIPILQKYNIYVAHGEEVRVMYPKYHNSSKNYNDVGVQAVINLDFALSKKLSYNGINITWDNTYIDWVNKIILKQEELSQYNMEDILLFTCIQPRTMNCRLEIKDIILEETQKYINEYRQKLQNTKSNFS